MNAIVNTRESFEEWYHPNFYTDPKTLAWEAWKKSRKDTLENAAKCAEDYPKYGDSIAEEIRSLK